MITKITLLVTAALIDLMMIGFGLLFFRRSPASVNAFFGYRTVRSMASPEAWAFAHRHFGKLILIVGVIWVPLSLGAISLLSFGGVEQYEPICAMIVLAQLIPFLIAIVSTERALKRHFDERGRPYPMLARDAAPILDDLKNAKEIFWENPHRITGAAAFGKAPFSVGDVADASARLSRFASYFAVAFPETADNGGLLESPLRKIPTMQQALEARYGVKIAGDLYIKLDSHLPVSGSIKARGGIYEVLCFAEHIAISEGGLLPTDDYAILDTPRFRALFSTYSIAVGSTGNLGLSIGLIGSRLGFSVTVHMSADAKQWKKDLLRSRGVRVVEHKGDYTAAVEYGRRIAERDPRCHFVDDENSALLFLGYAVAAERLAKQLREQKITVDREHPLYVYLPCGIGGAPGGVGFGLKLMFGDAVHLYFAEPTHAPCMLLGMATGRHSAISVTDIGLDPHTKADGLAVGRPSGFVGALMEPLLEGCYTVSDERMSAHLALLAEQEDIHLEPSALAGMYGPVVLQKQKNAPQAGTHIVWATGGSMVPPTEQDAYLKEGLDCLRNGF